MPEYLAPGVFVEEVSFRSKSIEGVPTSTTGFAGTTPYGPVCYEGGPESCRPRLITSFTEFERVYGGLSKLYVDVAGTERESYVGHAARAFYDNGGKRLYISRVFVPLSPTDDGVAYSNILFDPSATVTWRARWPGAYGNVFIRAEVVRSRNITYQHADSSFGTQVNTARAGAVVEVYPASTDPADIPAGNAPLELARLRVVSVDSEGKQSFIDQDGGVTSLNSDDTVHLCELRINVRVNEERIDVYEELGTSPLQKRDIAKILQRDDPEDEDATVWLDWEPDDVAGLSASQRIALAARLMNALRGTAAADEIYGVRLANGNDGATALPDDLKGKAADPDDEAKKATGLEALGEIDDIAIVALPESGTYDDEETSAQAVDRLIAHAKKERYRIAVLDAPRGSSMNEIRDFRGRFDSKYAALYHPWIEIFDPTERPAQGAPPKRIMLPPSGFIAGIYARSDIERGVHKAPANEVIRGLTRFETNINKPRQEVLNPEGINALRFFEGRGFRVWGARTISSDPEWKYVNVRRLFIFIEHSIDKGTQWAVFEPNNRKLWDNIRRTVEDFLLVLWKDGALMGAKPEEAFFVRCDRTTMTQNDLDNGRLICLIGIAPVKPAEFVIFRIGQWTGDTKI